MGLLKSHVKWLGLANMDGDTTGTAVPRSWRRNFEKKLVWRFQDIWSFSFSVCWRRCVAHDTTLWFQAHLILGPYGIFSLSISGMTVEKCCQRPTSGILDMSSTGEAGQVDRPWLVAALLDHGSIIFFAAFWNLFVSSNHSNILDKIICIGKPGFSSD